MGLTNKLDFVHSVLILQNKLSPAYGLISRFSRVSCIKLSQEKHVIFAELSSRILCHYSSIYPHLLLGSHWVWLSFSVATKIENGPKTNTKILWFLKIDQRRIQRIFVNSKILQRLQILQISSKIRRFSKENEKFLLLKIFFQAAT